MDEAPIKAVELVRGIRDEMYNEMKELSTEELQSFIAREARKATSAQSAAARSSARPAA